MIKAKAYSTVYMCDFPKLLVVEVKSPVTL